MNARTRLIYSALALACSVFVSLDVQAQSNGGMGGGMRRGGSERAARNADAATPQRAGPGLAQRLDEIAAQLLLTQAQGQTWTAFRAAFIATQTSTAGGVALSESGSALLTMQRQLSQAQNQFALVEALSDALKRLERELDPQQQAAADRLLPPLLAEVVHTGDVRQRPAAN